MAPELLSRTPAPTSSSAHRSKTCPATPVRPSTCSLTIPTPPRALPSKELNNRWEAEDPAATASQAILQMANVETATPHEAIQEILATRQPSPHTRSFRVGQLTWLPTTLKLRVKVTVSSTLTQLNSSTESNKNHKLAIPRPHSQKLLPPCRSSP